MHKRRSKHSGRARKWRNANTRLPEGCATIVRGLTEFLSDGRGSPSTDYLTEQYLSKFLDEELTPASERRSNAIQKWFSVEEKNRVVNARFRNIDMGYNILPRISIARFLKFARRLSSNILGPLKDSIVLGQFSGGASTSRRRTKSHPALKFLGEAHLTEEAWKYLDTLYREAPMLQQYSFPTSFREVEGAVLFTVAKKTDIDRCACKEPDINMYLQKGVGSHIRRRLRAFNINLNDQSVNRRLAWQGSISNDLATLDLSSASDTICIEVVRAILPTDWFEYLNDIRSQVVDVDGTLVRTEMFSSMGNGFTFELESLLFYVLMRAASYFEGIPGVISVYGDDLIIPSELYDPAVWILSEFGFTVNQDKSFHEGPFRESCGGHYSNGEDVTPFYLKREATHLTDVIRVANQLRRWACADPSRRYSMPSIYNVWTLLASFVPRDLWGGRDYNSDTQLVSPHSPINRLVRLTREKKIPDIGNYLL